ncbi:alpha/beta hydrolase [Gallibacterium melopsittaci]|uniref:Alpha/beta hydrolase n=1 Tax=Gallibacterium melopsittaci TaxID=516063 RepID=A0ABV6HVZ1_9PAST
MKKLLLSPLCYIAVAKHFYKQYRENLLCLISFFLLTTNSLAQQELLAMDKFNQYFTMSQTDISYQQQNYRLFIAVPKKTQTHRLLLLLDANAQFPIALSQLDLNKPLPLLVGIGYVTDQPYAVAERTRDYTFPAKGEEFSKGGKAADFLQFINTEVLPSIVQQHQIKQRIFFGHSFGGLFGLYTLFRQTNLFDDYVIASPSLWWGNGAITQYWTTHTTKPNSVVLTIGEYEQNPQADPHINPERLARIQQRRQHQQVKVETLQQQFFAKGWNSEFIVIPKANHGSSIPFAIKIAIEKAQQEN